jgi:hypothetical protein
MFVISFPLKLATCSGTTVMVVSATGGIREEFIHFVSYDVSEIFDQDCNDPHELNDVDTTTGSTEHDA